MNEFLQNITGGISAGKFASAFCFALLGLMVSLLLSATNRDPESPRTPFKFSLAFLISDNFKRIMTNGVLAICIIFLSIRFVFELAGIELSMFYSVGVGLFLDRAKRILQNKLNNTSTP